MEDIKQDVRDLGMLLVNHDTGKGNKKISIQKDIDYVRKRRGEDREDVGRNLLLNR